MLVKYYKTLLSCFLSASLSLSAGWRDEEGGINLKMDTHSTPLALSGNEAGIYNTCLVSYFSAILNNSK